MKLSHFSFELPDELLAEYPAENRDESKLMVVHRDTGKIEHKFFKDLIDYFDEGDVMHVLQSDFDDETSIKRYLFEKYARGIGLVARTDTLLDSRCKDLPDFSSCLGKPWTEHADKGYILSQVMIDHN